MFKAITISVFVVSAFYGVQTDSDYESKCAKENCTSEFKTVMECLKDAFAESEARIRQRFDEKKSDLETCFKDQSCTISSNSSRDPQKEKKLQCVRAVIDKGTKYIEDCVEEKLNIKLPDCSFNFTERPQFHPQMVCGLLNDSCGSTGDKKAVLQCATGVFQNDTSTLKNDYNQYCKADSQCLSKLSKGCLCQFWEVKTASEECVKKSFKANLTNDIPECQNLDHEEPDPLCTPSGMANGSPTLGQGKSQNKNLCGTFEQYQGEHFTYGGSEGGQKGYTVPPKKS